MTTNYHKELVQVAAVAIAALQDDLRGSTDIEHPDGARFLIESLNDITNERISQEKKWGPQHHSKEHWLAILTEEVGEVARDILENP